MAPDTKERFVVENFNFLDQNKLSNVSFSNSSMLPQEVNDRCGKLSETAFELWAMVFGQLSVRRRGVSLRGGETSRSAAALSKKKKLMESWREGFRVFSSCLTPAAIYEDHRWHEHNSRVCDWSFTILTFFCEWEQPRACHLFAAKN